jgi:protein-S-isoprenylcysteine O-methyltransferase Ste14
MFIQPAVAGLDAVRFGWLSMLFGTVYAGAILYVLATILVARTMAVNPHLETAARIQSDRSHRVVTSDPSRIVRHPIYLGGNLQTVAVPLVLGSEHRPLRRCSSSSSSAALYWKIVRFATGRRFTVEIRPGRR